jgi:hypothetical protein
MLDTSQKLMTAQPEPDPPKKKSTRLVLSMQLELAEVSNLFADSGW